MHPYVHFHVVLSMTSVLTLRPIAGDPLFLLVHQLVVPQLRSADEPCLAAGKITAKRFVVLVKSTDVFSQIGFRGEALITVKPVADERLPALMTHLVSGQVALLTEGFSAHWVRAHIRAFTSVNPVMSEKRRKRLERQTRVQKLGGGLTL